MKRSWVSLILLVTCLFVLMVGGLSIKAAPGPFPDDAIRCPRPACTETCISDPDPGALRICTEGKNGHAFLATFACCCCNEDAKNRWFHGG